MAEEWVNKLEERPEGKYTEQSIEGKKENTECFPECINNAWESNRDWRKGN